MKKTAVLLHRKSRILRGTAHATKEPVWAAFKAWAYFFRVQWYFLGQVPTNHVLGWSGEFL